MSYDKRVLEAAKAELDRRRQTAEGAAAARLEEFFRQCPRAAQIREEMAHSAAAAARAVLSGGDVRTQMEQQKARSLALRAEYDQLLASRGLTRQDVTPQYHCPVCRDTGFVDGRMCACYRQLRKGIAYQQLSEGLPLATSTFERFSLERYRGDERVLKQMASILRVCREYADRLRPHSSSLLFYGGTGLGKTHLSLAIANAAIEKGLGVVYGSVQGFSSSLERERFDREDGQSTSASLKECDLLILDDLGAEAGSGYVNAALYDVINSRMLADKPTIISSNLNLKELEKRYGERMTSRISGYYGKLQFMGSDMRAKGLQRQTGN